jgi:hypothetical protein
VRGEILKTQASFLLLIGAMLFLPACDFDRSRAFRKKVKEGTPIVRAIEQFHKDTGSYPASVAELAPKYLSAEVATNVVNFPHPFRRWGYYTFANGEAVSYSLTYFMGKGGVDYTPPNWTGDNDGHRMVIDSGP